MFLLGIIQITCQSHNVYAISHIHKPRRSVNVKKIDVTVHFFDTCTAKNIVRRLSSLKKPWRIKAAFGLITTDAMKSAPLLG
jgi:hypothetical protein